jgi:hypothetical protein
MVVRMVNVGARMVACPNTQNDRQEYYLCDHTHKMTKIKADISTLT